MENPQIYSLFDKNLNRIAEVRPLVEIDPSMINSGSLLGILGQNIGNINVGKLEFTNNDAGYILGVDKGISKFYIGDDDIFLNWTGTELVITNIIFSPNDVGDIVMSTADTTDGSDPKNIYLQSGSAITTGNGNGGDVQIVGGTGIGSGAGGQISIVGGEADESGTGVGGGVAILPGDGGGVSGIGGFLTLTTGNATGGNSAGGTLLVRTGHGKGSSDGGTFSLLTGNADEDTGTGAGGTVRISAGDGGGVSGDGGPIIITAGDAVAGNSDGGSITLKTGVKSGSGTNGKFIFNSVATTADGILDFDSLTTSDKTFTFPDASGTIALQGLAGTKVYYVSDSSGGAVTRKLTFTNGILTSET